MQVYTWEVKENSYTYHTRSAKHPDTGVIEVNTVAYWSKRIRYIYTPVQGKHLTTFRKIRMSVSYFPASI